MLIIVKDVYVSECSPLDVDLAKFDVVSTKVFAGTRNGDTKTSIRFDGDGGPNLGGDGLNT